MHLTTRPAVRLGMLLAAAVLLTGCSSDELDVDGFEPGACADVAPALQDLDQSLREYGSDDLSAQRAAAEFEAAQDALLAASPDADELVEAAMTTLVTDLGFLRVAADNGLDDATSQEDARTALDGLATQCRGS